MRPGDHGDSRCALSGRPSRPGRPRPAHSSRLFLAPPTGPALGASRLGRLTAWAPFLGQPSRPAHHAGAFGPTFPVNPFSALSPPGVLGRRLAVAATVRPVAATPTSSPGSASSRRPPLGEAKRLFLRHLRLHAPELPSPSGTPPSPRDPSPGCRGRGCPPPPKRCRGPLGWKPQGKPVRAFLHPANAGQVRAPHGVRGPPRSRSPSYSPGLPLSRAGFSPPPQGVQAPLRQRVLPTAHRDPFSPAATGPGSRPRGSPVRPRYLPPSRLRYALAACVALSPYEVPELGVLQPGDGPCGLQAACSGQRGSRTLPVSGLAIVRPRLWLPGSAGPPVSLGPLVSHDTLSTGHPCTRRGAMGSLPAGGGTCTHFPRPSPRGWSPGTLSASPNRLLPGSPGLWECSRAQGCAPDALR